MKNPMNPSSTPMSDEELRKRIEAAYEGACTPDGFYQAHFLDRVMTLIAHHTKEAVEAARREELEAFKRLTYPNKSPFGNQYLFDYADARIALLAAPQQSTSPDGSAE